MVMETASTPVPEATPDASSSFGDQVEETPPATEEVQAPPTEEPVEAPAELEVWDSAHERYRETPEFKSWYERETEQSRRQGHIEGQRREAGKRQEVMATLSQIDPAIRGLNASLKKAVDSGMIDAEELSAALAQNPGLVALTSFTEQAKTQAGDESAKVNVARAIAKMAAHPSIGNKELGAKFAERFMDEWSYDNGEHAFTSFVEDAVKAARTQAREPLEKQIRQLKAELEKAKASGNDGKGPATAQASPSSSGLTYRQMMDLPLDEYEKVPEETKRRLVNAEAERRK